jgi:uncharacterized membrane protein YhaH (DUF805 family)
MKEFFTNILTTKGRINRKQFWIYQLISLFVFFPIFLALIIFWLWWIDTIQKTKTLYKDYKYTQEWIKNTMNNWYSKEAAIQSKEIQDKYNEMKKIWEDLEKELKNFKEKYVFIFLLLFIYFSIWYILVVSYIKRLHDLNKSWLLLILWFIPFINFILVTYCWTFKWTTWKNSYWEEIL